MARHTTSMKEGWLCRTSCDEKNHEITHMMMTRGDPKWVMIHIQLLWLREIQIEWWSRSSSDDPNWVMIHIQQWWSRSSDDPHPVMKMNWTWRWLDSDPDDTEKKICADKLCRENTFLVKREYWCICNFGMYSLVYCTPMFISGSICNVIEWCHAPMFRSGDSIM